MSASSESLAFSSQEDSSSESYESSHHEKEEEEDEDDGQYSAEEEEEEEEKVSGHKRELGKIVFENSQGESESLEGFEEEEEEDEKQESASKRRIVLCVDDFQVPKEYGKFHFLLLWVREWSVATRWIIPHSALSKLDCAMLVLANNTVWDGEFRIDLFTYEALRYVAEAVGCSRDLPKHRDVIVKNLICDKTEGREEHTCRDGEWFLDDQAHEDTLSDADLEKQEQYFGMRAAYAKYVGKPKSTKKCARALDEACEWLDRNLRVPEVSAWLRYKIKPKQGQCMLATPERLFLNICHSGVFAKQKTVKRDV